MNRSYLSRKLAIRRLANVPTRSLLTGNGVRRRVGNSFDLINYCERKH